METLKLKVDKEAVALMFVLDDTGVIESEAVSHGVIVAPNGKNVVVSY